MNSIAFMPGRDEQLIVCNRSPTVYITTLEGKLVQALSSGKSEGGRLKSAYDVAKETKVKPIGGAVYERQVASLKRAKSARVVYRSNKKLIDAVVPAPKAEDEEAEEKAVRRGGAGEMDESMLAASQAEFATEDGEEGDEDGGEEGEEGLNDDEGDNEATLHA